MAHTRFRQSSAMILLERRKCDQLTPFSYCSVFSGVYALFVHRLIWFVSICIPFCNLASELISSGYSQYHTFALYALIPSCFIAVDGSFPNRPFSFRPGFPWQAHLTRSVWKSVPLSVIYSVLYPPPPQTGRLHQSYKFQNIRQYPYQR